ncbi:PH domain-containing protein [Gilvibacter sediminis]|uniref:PH domain-containing protein n=1 Tax=Gilvibacter sediminis TaxID=379071 RepID=UPI00235052A8|nr:PH domain-containing protein [Gilvibacter sediminis]MDC7997526.1 PH domain-containing protein [Gilvibacter sediminis]
MHQNLQSELRSYLNPGEGLIWTGKPKQGVVFRSADVFMIPFTVLWCGFAIFWVIMASEAGAFALFGIPFVLVGLFLVFGRFFVDARVRAKTVYGITQDRILIKSGVFSTTLNSVSIKNISHLEYQEKSDRSGSILLGPRSPHQRWSSGMSWWPGMKTAPQLELIKDVRNVYNKITELQRGDLTVNF